ncbi:metallophosphoesterase [Lysinimonas soli]|uniref:Metallophosphoesterase n=1 Tax=Lysinimonas soli TaxID=1074233 RepID=A0ABW0NSM3_9MICO
MTRAGRGAATALGVAAAVGLGAFAWGALVERTRFTVRHEVLPVLARGARPLTVLHLSDLHMAPWQAEKQAFIQSLVRYEPDLIVDTGDNLGHVDGLICVKEALEPFEGVPGVFVHGSNDYLGPVLKNPFGYFRAPSIRHERSVELDTAALELFFEDELGWLDLNNTARAMEIRGTRIEFYGTGDAHRGWDRLATLPGAIDEMRENVEWDESSTGQVLGIGVTHAPYQRVLNSFVNQGADLIFAGHTHGGQVRIPGLPALVTNCDIPREQAQGVSVWRTPHGGAFLEVSAGIGTSIYAPVRFACPPEAVVVTLVAPN